MLGRVNKKNFLFAFPMIPSIEPKIPVTLESARTRLATRQLYIKAMKLRGNSFYTCYKATNCYSEPPYKDCQLELFYKFVNVNAGLCSINPLSPNIYKAILRTDLHTFP